MSQYNLYPATIVAYDQGANGGWAQGGVPTVAAMNKPYGQWNDATANHCFWADSTGPNTGSAIRVSLTELPPIFTISSITLTVRIQRSGGTFTGAEHRPFIYIGSTYYYVDAFSHTAFGYYNQAISWTLSPATGLPFTRAEINAMNAGLYARNLDATLSTGPFLSALVLTVVATGAPNQNEQARDVASRRQWRMGHNVRTLRNQSVKSSVGHALDIMGVVKLAHTDGPEAAGEGWKPRPWQLRHFQVRQWEPRDDGTVVVSGPERRELRALFVDSQIVPSSASPLAEDGVLRFHKGVAFSYTRTNAVYTRDPGSGLFVLVNANEKPFGENGYEAIGAFTQDIQYSAFQAGDITGWTKAGTGTNGSDVAADSAFVIGSDLGETFGWDPDSTGVTQNALFTAGTPHTADLKLTSTATPSYAANTLVAVSVWFTDYSYSGGYNGTPRFSVALQRQVDNFYWDFVTATWSAFLTWYDLSNSGFDDSEEYSIYLRGEAYGHRAFHYPPDVNVGANATTLKLILGFPSGAASGATARAYAAQLNATNGGGMGLPPLLTTNASVSRSSAVNKVFNTLAKPAVSNSQGSFACTIRPMWVDYATSANVVRALWYCHHDSNNHMMVAWSNRGSASGDLPAGTGFVFQIKSAGNYYRVLIDSPVILPNWPLRLIARWTGTEAEHGLAANTMTLFLTAPQRNAAGYAVQSRSDDLVYVPCTPSDDSYLEIGRAAAIGTGTAFGSLTRIVSRPYPPSDEECYRSGWIV